MKESLDFTATDPLTGKTRDFLLKEEPSVAIGLRLRNKLAFTNRNKDVETVASVLGLNPTSMTFVRSSPEWKAEVVAFIKTEGLVNNAQLRKRLGVVNPSRKARSRSFKAVTKSEVSEFGGMVVSKIRELVEEDDDRQITFNYLKKVLDECITFSDLPNLPSIKSHEAAAARTKLEKLQNQVDILNAQLESHGIV